MRLDELRAPDRYKAEGRRRGGYRGDGPRREGEKGGELDGGEEERWVETRWTEERRRDGRRGDGKRRGVEMGGDGREQLDTEEKLDAGIMSLAFRQEEQQTKQKKHYFEQKYWYGYS